MKANRRHRGISLMEVMISIAILAASSILLAQLAGVGRQHSSKSAMAAKAQELASNKLNELLAGIELLEPIEDQPFLDELEWTYSVSVTELETTPLLSEVAVAVKHVPPAEQESVGSSADSSPPIYHLVRWIRTPDTSDGGFDF